MVQVQNIQPDDENDTFKAVDQEQLIGDAAAGLHRGLKRASTLHAVFNIATQIMSELWVAPRLYLYDPQKKLAILASGIERDAKESNYADWRSLRSLFEEARRSYAKSKDPRTLSVVDLKEQEQLHLAGREKETITDYDSIKDDYDKFKLIPGNPGKLVYGVFAFRTETIKARYAEDIEALRENSIFGFWLGSNRVPNDEEGAALVGRYPGLYSAEPLSKNNTDPDIASKLYALVLRKVGERISMLTAGRDFQEMWRAEARKIAEEEENSGARRSYSSPGQDAIATPTPTPTTTSLVKVDEGKEGQSQGMTVIDSKVLDKRSFLSSGERGYAGRKISFYTQPIEEFIRCRSQMKDWLQQLMLRIYGKTDEYKDQSSEKIHEALDLDGIERRVLSASYVMFGQKTGGEEVNAVGAAYLKTVGRETTVTGKLVYISIMMAEGEARGNKFQVRCGLEFIKQSIYKTLKDDGFRGLWRLMTKGVPIAVRVQSKRPAIGMLRLKNLWAPISDPDEKMKGLIKRLSEDEGISIEELEKNGYIMKDVYKGAVRIREEEEEIKFVNKLGWLHKSIFNIFGYKTSRFRKYEALDDLFDNKIGKRGAVFLVGYSTLGVVVFNIALPTIFQNLLGRIVKLLKKDKVRA